MSKTSTRVQLADASQLGTMQSTANAFSRLAATYGLSGVCLDCRADGYYVNGERLGQSIHCAYAWMKRQPGYNPDFKPSPPR